MNNNKYKILLVEDEDHINNLVTTLLTASGYQVISAASCRNGLMLFSSHIPDLVILDLGLPDLDGMEFLKTIRKDSLTPLIVLSARTEEQDKVEALDMGANDYITKPFGSSELLARVRTALCNTGYRSEEGRLPGGTFRSGDLMIDYEARRIFIHTEEIKFTQTEYNILALLSEHAGKVMTYSAIIKAVWGYDDPNSTKKLQVNMANIRKKMGAIPGKNNYIINELGVGYRMSEQDELTR